MYNFASLFFVSKLSLDRFFDFLLSLSLSLACNNGKRRVRKISIKRSRKRGSRFFLVFVRNRISDILRP